jgi:glutathione S-transferase
MVHRGEIGRGAGLMAVPEDGDTFRRTRMTIRLHELVGSDPARPFSPHCWKTVMSLAHKGLDFESVPTPFTRVPDTPGGARIVPVIEDRGQIVADSFAVALYLEEAYPDRPSLFGGKGGLAMARFIEGWAQTQLHSVLGLAAIMDIHDMLDPVDQVYLRESREKRFGMSLEAARDKGQAQLQTLSARLDPLRMMLKSQDFIGGDGPLFADYIVFGAFQWVRICSSQAALEDGDPVRAWFERCLDLHGAIGRAVPAAA